MSTPTSVLVVFQKEDEEGEAADSDDEEDDGFFVPHGYLSDDEGCEEDEEDVSTATTPSPVSLNHTPTPTPPYPSPTLPRRSAPMFSCRALHHPPFCSPSASLQNHYHPSSHSPLRSSALHLPHAHDAHTQPNTS